VSVLPQDETGKAEHGYSYDFEMGEVAIYVDDGAGGVELWDGSADFTGDVEVDTDALEALVAAGNAILTTIDADTSLMVPDIEAIKVAVEIIDNFISGARGLVTEDNSAAILALGQDNLANYKMDDFDVSSDPKYIGFQTKGGAYYITRYNIASPAVDYTKGASGYSAAWTNRAGESYSDFASTF